MTTNDTQALEAFARECAEIANALKSEYGEIKTHRGVEYFDYSKHVYVGRAGALLRQAAALASRQDQQGQAWQAPEGWKLVPVEPTDAMLDEGVHQVYEPTNRNDLERAWSEMVAAAPLPHASKETAP
jgi:hypothetical protein